MWSLKPILIEKKINNYLGTKLALGTKLTNLKKNLNLIDISPNLK